MKVSEELVVHKAIKFKPRNPKLLEMEGWYETPRSPLYQMYQDSGSRIKFSSWLAKNGIDVGSKLGKQLMVASVTTKFKVTCRYHDILRCSSMYKNKYFTSCLNPDDKEANSNAPNRLRYLRFLPDVAMLYVPDKAGHIKSRAFFVLQPPNEYSIGRFVIHPWRFYGDDNLSNCFDLFATQHSLCIQSMPWHLDQTWRKPLELSHHPYPHNTVYFDTTFDYSGEQIR